MIDYIASKSAHREYEERVRSLTPVRDYDEWLKSEAGHWQSPSLGGVLSSLVKSLASIGNRPEQQPQATRDVPQTAHEGSGVTG